MAISSITNPARHGLCLLLAACLAAFPAAAGAAPTSSPELPLLVRPDPINTPLMERATALDEVARRAIEQLEGRPAPPQIGSAEVAAVGQAAVACFYLNEFGKQLALRSEAAGSDYQLRSTYLTGRLRGVVGKWRTAANFRLDDVLRLAKQVHDAGLVQLPALEASLQQGELETGERTLLAIIAEIERFAIWDEREIGKYKLPFSSLLANRIEKPLEELRRKRTTDDLTAVLAQASLNFDDLPLQLSRATADIGRVGITSWGSESVSGPELVARVGAEWQRTQVRAQRMVMAELAARIAHGPVPPGVERVQTALATQQEKVLQGLAELVKVDTARVEAASVAPLYQRYVGELARLALLGDRVRFQAALQPALNELAAKDAVFQAEVAAYTTATTELLRWRRRFATAQARHQLKTCPMLPATLAAIGVKKNTPGVLVENNPPDHAALLDAAPLVLRHWHETALGRHATATDTSGLGGGKTVSRYQSRTYSRLTVPVSQRLDNETRALKRSLLVTSVSPPLSLDAALAVVSAEQGSYPFVGGTISEIYLEPLLTRFLLLPDRSVGLLPLGALPSEPYLFDLRSHVLVRCDLAPTWIGHECFVVDLAR